MIDYLKKKVKIKDATLHFHLKKKLPSVLLILLLLYLFVSLFFAQQLNASPEGLEERKLLKELKLSSILYELAVALVHENFANEHGIFLSEGKVRVFIYLDPASKISERKELVRNYNIVVEKKANDLLRGLVPVDELISLSKATIIRFISLPDRPTK